MHWDENLTAERATHLAWLYLCNTAALHKRCMDACRRTEGLGLLSLIGKLKAISLTPEARQAFITPRMVGLADWVQLAQDWRQRFIEIEGEPGATPFERKAPKGGN